MWRPEAWLVQSSSFPGLLPDARRLRKLTVPVTVDRQQYARSPVCVGCDVYALDLNRVQEDDRFKRQ